MVSSHQRGIPEPVDDRGERQDRRPDFQRRPLHAPDRVVGEDSPVEPTDDPRRSSGASRIAPGQHGRAACSGPNRSITCGGRIEPWPAGVTSRKASPSGRSMAVEVDQAVEPVGPARPPEKWPSAASPKISQSQERAEGRHRRHLGRGIPAPARSPTTHPPLPSLGLVAAPSRRLRRSSTQSSRPGVSVPAMWPSP